MSPLAMKRSRRAGLHGLAGGFAASSLLLLACAHAPAGSRGAVYIDAQPEAMAVAGKLEELLILDGYRVVRGPGEGVTALQLTQESAIDRGLRPGAPGSYTLVTPRGRVTSLDEPCQHAAEPPLECHARNLLAKWQAAPQEAAPPARPARCEARSPCPREARLPRCDASATPPVESALQGHRGDRIALRGPLAARMTTTTAMACSADQPCCNALGGSLRLSGALLTDAQRADRFSCSGQGGVVCCGYADEPEALAVGTVKEGPDGDALEVESLCRAR